MAGIILIFILAGWCFLIKKLSELSVFKMNESNKKEKIKWFVFILLLIAPFYDEIIGGFQFRALCHTGSVPIYDPEKLKNTTLLSVSTPRVKLNGFMVPIEESDRKWVDVNTKELLLEYKGYDARGGWLSSSIGFNRVYKPYTFDGSCGITNNEFQKLKKEFNFNYVYR